MKKPTYKLCKGAASAFFEPLNLYSEPNTIPFQRPHYGSMYAKKKWPKILIFLVLALTTYNILPTVFYYAQP